jgi:phage terminase large subunit-like protein
VVRRAVLSISRKNGKFGLTAGIATAHLIGPEAIPNGQIFSAATDREQAAIVFKLAQQIVELEPKLAAKIEIIPSTKKPCSRGRMVQSIARSARKLAPNTGTARAL